MRFRDILAFTKVHYKVDVALSHLDSILQNYAEQGLQLA